MKHFYLMHGMMGECPKGDESGAYVSAIAAKSEITDLQQQLEQAKRDCQTLYQDMNRIIPSLDHEIWDLHADLATAKSEIADLQNDKLEMSDIIRGLRDEITQLTERAERAEGLIQHLGNRSQAGEI